MRKSIQSGMTVLLCAAGLISIVSCNKEMSATNNTNNAATNTTSTSSTIAVATDSTGADSIYIMQPCERGFFRDSIAESALPDSVQSYLTNNYPGYSFQRGFQIKDSLGNTGGYVVIISYNGKPVALLFDASGNFQKVLEQREHGDMEGEGWHPGGRFCNRDGTHRDTVAIAALPSAIGTYMSTNYPSDTLVRAYRNIDSSYLVISRNGGLYANLFTAGGDFVKRIPLLPPVFIHNPPALQNVLQDSLPAASLSYLTSTYPNYVFESALSVTVQDQLQGYVVVIDANNTKYAIWFDAAGNVVATLTIW